MTTRSPPSSPRATRRRRWSAPTRPTPLGRPPSPASSARSAASPPPSSLPRTTRRPRHARQGDPSDPAAELARPHPRRRPDVRGPSRSGPRPLSEPSRRGLLQRHELGTDDDRALRAAARQRSNRSADGSRSKRCSPRRNDRRLGAGGPRSHMRRMFNIDSPPRILHMLDGESASSGPRRPFAERRRRARRLFARRYRGRRSRRPQRRAHRRPPRRPGGGLRLGRHHFARRPGADQQPRRAGRAQRRADDAGRPRISGARARRRSRHRPGAAARRRRRRRCRRRGSATARGSSAARSPSPSATRSASTRR